MLNIFENYLGLSLSFAVAVCMHHDRHIPKEKTATDDTIQGCIDELAALPKWKGITEVEKNCALRWVKEGLTLYRPAAYQPQPVILRRLTLDSPTPKQKKGFSFGDRL